MNNIGDLWGELWADVRRFTAGILGFFALFLGSWAPPPWLRLLGEGIAALARSARRQPRTAVAVVGAAVILLAGGGALQRWYRHRPRPSVVALQVVAPPATDFREQKKPQPLRLRFGASAAPLSAIRKEVASGPATIDLQPRLDGAWRWEDDKELTFTPRADWPVGQHYLVSLARKGLLADTAHLERYQVEFDSARFEVALGGSEFYQDPTDPAQKQVVATATFSHPVDAAAFEAHLRATLTRKGDKAGAPLPLHVTYDKWKGSAAIHSAPIPVPERDADVELVIDRGVRAARGGPAAAEVLAAHVEVPGLYSYFHVGAVRATNVENDRGEPDQVLVVETSAGVSERELARHLRAWLLPVFDPESPDEKQRGEPHAWDNAALIGDALRRPDAAVKLEPIATEREFETVHSFRYHAPPGRWLSVQVDKGAVSFGGYVLAEAHGASLAIPELPRALRILGAGALVSLSGERKVPIYARDVPGVRLEIGRVLPGQIQHLVSQSSGRFERPSLDGWRLGADNLSELFVETRKVASPGPGKPSYLALDLQRYFDAPGGGQRRGLFLLKATAFDPDKEVALEESDTRLLLLTDLGVVVKDAQDGAHDLFVQSIHDGLPVAGATVQVLGKNGLPVLSATTDAEGHAAIAAFQKLERERTPTLYLVRKGADESFLPIGRYDRYLDVSRFDVGGVHERADGRKLSAFLFSDRGIYRPGDEIRAGLIVKPDGWQRSLEGMPVQVTVTDARGLTVQSRTVALDATGFREVRQATLDTSPTGTWVISAYIVKDGRPGALLGSTTVRVREFQPDRMKLAARLSAEAARGWVSPDGLKGLATLENLFGTAAAAHRVRGRIVLTPGLPAVGKWRDYQFADPLRAKDSFSDDLEEQKTDDKGQAAFDLKLGRFARATYRLHFLAEGFEAEGGRSVSADAEVTVSPLPFLVGWKADGDLGYVSRGARRTVEVVAISPRAEALAVGELKAVLLQRKYVSVLTRQDNGTYKYQSVMRELPLSDRPLAIAAAGHRQALPSDKPGDFAWVIRGAADEELARVQYTVAGTGNLARSLEKDAELQLALKTPDLEPGGTLELSIKAPYAGAGLITIERDKVHAWKWFKADTTATVQTIALPPGLEGGGYVSVSLLRDLNSDEIFMSPLSYGVLPFSISKARRTARVTVTSPDSARPGEPYRMRYKTDRPARIVVFAVDEGILRVAGYKTPDPLALFFEKRALEVRTGQILDLVLPEYARLMAHSAPGGDADRLLAAHLNPFKRKRDVPAAFWSGVLDAGPDEREVSFTLPDSFNGTLRVMAVAVASDAIGTFEKRATVRGDFVISPNAPTFVAPGDEFDVTVSVANTAAGSGKGATVALALATGPELELLGPGKPGEISLPIPELAEGHASFRLRALRRLGSATLTFTATSGSHKARLAVDLSVRPPAPYLTTFAAGRLEAGQSAEARLERNLYPEFRVQRAGASPLPLALAHGLTGYLEKFPHGCTEQLVSQGVPALVLGKQPDFGFDRAASQKAVQKVIDMLATRQNGEGAFGLWAAGPFVAPVPSVWAVEFLLEAADRGYDVPPAMRRGALGWLQQLAGSPGSTLADERLRAQATYLLTRSGLVTSSFAAGIRQRLEAEHAAAWKQDAAAAWLAGTYALLHEDKLARALVDELRLGAGVPGQAGWGDYHDALTRDSQLLYVIARHFPERARRVGTAELAALAQPIFQGAYNTLSSASVILALEAYGRVASAPAAGGGGLRVEQLLAGGATRGLDLPPGSLLPWVDVPADARGLRFQAGGGFPAFFVASQAGFDLDPPPKAIAERLEVLREYTDGAGKPLTRVRLGDEVQVHLRVRSLGAPVSNLALVDLLPGGFEVVVQPQGDRAAEPDDAPAARPGGEDGEGDGEGGEGGEGGGDAAREPTPYALPIALPGASFQPDYGDVREDRVVLYGAADKDVREFVYAIKAVTRGRFAVAPLLGESMYDRSATARGLGGAIEVVER